MNHEKVETWTFEIQDAASAMPAPALDSVVFDSDNETPDPRDGVTLVSQSTTGTCTDPECAPDNGGPAWYVSNTSPQKGYEHGCNTTAKRRGRGAVVLFMGQPWKKGSTFGTNNHAPGAPFVSIAANEKLARFFAAAYAYCLPKALKDRGWKINLVLSQNNYGGKPGSGRPNYVDYASGAAWAAMVQRVGQWIRANGHARYVRVSGGMDFESSYGSASRGRDWVSGFTSATNYPMFNTGSLNGCPPRGSCIEGWTLSDYYYVSAGADRNVFPLPQIYVRDLARQWANLSRWGVTNGNRGRLRFLGPLSQHINDRRTYDASHAWSALFQEINKSTSTSQTSMPSTTFLRGSAEKTRW